MATGKRQNGEEPRSAKRVRLATLGDIHCGKTSQGAYHELFRYINENADVFVLCGDLTDHGLPEEAQVLAREMTSQLKIPTVAVLGNHDYHAGKQKEIEQVMTDAGVRMLDGEACEIHGVGFAGVKGFGGGFGRHTLEPWGEDTIKGFVMEAIDQALKLETALARVHVPQRIAVLHYAPIRGTVEGEPPEIFPFLGSSRLEEPLNRIPVHVVLHGHAHHGAPEGRTRSNTPVYNVSLPLLRTLFKDRPPVRLLEVPLTPPAEGDGESPGQEALPPAVAAGR
jgi:Icc-related predicted phosphoesterase